MRIKLVQKLIDKLRNKNTTAVKNSILDSNLKNGCTIDNIKHIIKTKENINFVYNKKTKSNIEACIYEVFTRRDYDVAINKDAILIDVGLNVATTSLFFASKPWMKKCYGFEPFPKTFEDAKDNIALNQDLKNKIEIFNFGLGKEEKTLEIEYNEEQSACMSTTYNSFEELNSICKEVQGKVNVEIKEAKNVLTEILSKHKNEKIILKVDTEGAEFDIFENIDNTDILNNINIVFIEWHKNSPKTLEQILIKHGFAVKFLPAYQEGMWGGMIMAVRI